VIAASGRWSLKAIFKSLLDGLV